MAGIGVDVLIDLCSADGMEKYQRKRLGRKLEKVGVYIDGRVGGGRCCDRCWDR